jgi:hypothetical protein
MVCVCAVGGGCNERVPGACGLRCEADEPECGDTLQLESMRELGISWASLFVPSVIPRAGTFAPSWRDYHALSGRVWGKEAGAVLPIRP